MSDDDDSDDLAKLIEQAGLNEDARNTLGQWLIAARQFTRKNEERGFLKFVETTFPASEEAAIIASYEDRFRLDLTTAELKGGLSLARNSARIAGHEVSVSRGRTSGQDAISHIEKLLLEDLGYKETSDPFGVFRKRSYRKVFREHADLLLNAACGLGMLSPRESRHYSNEIWKTMQRLRRASLAT